MEALEGVQSQVGDDWHVGSHTSSGEQDLPVAGVPCRPSYPPQDRNFPINIVTATVTVNAHHSLITRLLPGRCSAVVVLGQLTVDATRKHCHRTLVLGGQGDALVFTDGAETTVPPTPSSYGTCPE